jgi:chromosome partitioning protein
MTRIITVALPKGGTGKTTTTLNLGAALHEQGKHVLLVDIDPTGSLTNALGIPAASIDYSTASIIQEYLTTFEVDLQPAIRATYSGIDLVPAGRPGITKHDLSIAQSAVEQAIQREWVLYKILGTVADRYDVVLIDTPPNLAMLVKAALVAATEILIPLEAEYLATEAVTMLLQEVQRMRKQGLDHLRVRGIVLTQVDQRTVLHREVIEYAHAQFGTHVPIFNTMIRRSIRVPESQARHVSMLQYEPHGEVAEAYRSLAKEVTHAAA